MIDGGDWLTATHESSTDTSAVESRVLMGLNNIRSARLEPAVLLFWTRLRRYTGLTIEIKNSGLMDSSVWSYRGEALLDLQPDSPSKSEIDRGCEKYQGSDLRA